MHVYVKQIIRLGIKLYIRINLKNNMNKIDHTRLTHEKLEM